MPQLTNDMVPISHRLGRLPVTADDIVVLLMDALYDHEAFDEAERELFVRLRAILETPLAVEIYDREMERRQPRDATRWH
ncbi:hypothetical protein VW35_01920 [Devosia soli]|uniref:Uncharacterized protein n=1 Tax=Devosia soli TaxID=361041 RepID=A0A0F5LEZ2_9HYPH|nr:hypothetical protein [Devosia soli]KKB80961.1 hypothetical protein VW35_01920 [Devosia soli]